MSEVCAHFFPRLVELHNYTKTNAASQKLINWQTLNSTCPSLVNLSCILSFCWLHSSLQRRYSRSLESNFPRGTSMLLLTVTRGLWSVYCCKFRERYLFVSLWWLLKVDTPLRLLLLAIDCQLPKWRWWGWWRRWRWEIVKDAFRYQSAEEQQDQQEELRGNGRRARGRG